MFGINVPKADSKLGPKSCILPQQTTQKHATSMTLVEFLLALVVIDIHKESSP